MNSCVIMTAPGAGSTLPAQFTRHSDLINASPSDDKGKQNLYDEIKRRANHSFAQKHFEEAEFLYTEALKWGEDGNSSRPTHTLFGNRSMARLKMGKKEPALEDANDAIRADAKWAKGYFRKGSALEDLDRYADAVEAFEKAQAMDSSSKNVELCKNKVVGLLKKIKKHGPNRQQEPEKATAPGAPVKSSSTIKKSSSSSKSTPSKSVEKVEDDDLTKMGNTKGYKTTADGRKTTFFNNELTDEEKKLIGDIAPKKISDSSSATIKNVEGGSAWNVGNTFEEKDVGKWAQGRMKQLLKDSVYEDKGKHLKIVVDEVKDMEGDASIAVLRGGKRHIFDYTFTLKVTLLDTSMNDQSIAVGSIKYLDVSSDSGGDFDAEATVADRHHKPQAKMLYNLLNSDSSGLQKVIHDRIENIFVKEFRGQ